MAEATAAVPAAVKAPEPKKTIGDLDPTKTEVRVGIQHAAGVENAKDRGKALSPEQKAVFDRGRAQLEANQAEASLQTLRSGFTRTDWQKTVNNRILTGPEDASGNKAPRNTAEADEANRLNTFIQTAENYTQNGFDKLTPREQTALTAHLADMINNNVVLADALAFRVDSTTNKPVVDAATVQNLLKQEGFQAQVADILNDRLNPEASQKEKELDTSMEINRAGVDVAKGTKAAKEAEKKQIEGAPAARKAFDNDIDATTGKTKAKDMQDRAAALATTASGNPDIDMGLQGLKNNLEGLDTVAKQIKATPKDAPGYPALIAEQAKLQRWVDGAKSFPSPHGEQATQYAALYTESQQINNDISRTGEIPQIDAAIAKADATIATLDKEFMKSLSEREGISAEFAKGIDQVMAQATEQYMQEKVFDYIQSYRDVGENIPSELTSKHAEALQKALNERWTETYKGGILGRTDKERINKGQAERDMASLAKDGPDSIIIDSLKQAGVPDAEITLMTKDVGFMNSQRSEVTAKALAAYLGTGGKLMDQQVYALSLKSYGEAAMQRMVDLNDVAKGNIAKLREAGIINTGSISEMRQKFGGKGLLWLLLGSAIAGVATASRLAEKEAISTVVS